MSVDPLIHLSQAHLNVLVACPRQFQYLYVDPIGLPVSLDHQEQMASGSRFHLLIQQWQMGLPIAPLMDEDSELHQWFQAFVTAAPEIFGPEEAGEQRLCEHSRSHEWQGYLLTVVYDLLVLRGDHAQILDWKTYRKPKRTQELKENWQTRLYPFVLAETSGYDPDQMAMTYWFFASDSPKPQKLHLPYSRSRHEQTRRALDPLLAKLTEWLRGYGTGVAFPQDLRACDHCRFQSLCFGRSVGGPSDPMDLSQWPDPADIQEVII